MIQLLGVKEYIALGAGLVLALALGAQTVRLHQAHADLAQEQAAVAKLRLDASNAARDAEARFRATERDFTRQAEEKRNDHKVRTDASERRFAALRADNDRMRVEIAGFAAGRGEYGDGSTAACEARASALGDVLADSVRVQEDLARAAEARLEDARSLYEWAVIVEQELKKANEKR